MSQKPTPNLPASREGEFLVPLLGSSVVKTALFSTQAQNPLLGGAGVGQKVLRLGLMHTPQIIPELRLLKKCNDPMSDPYHKFIIKILNGVVNFTIIPNFFSPLYLPCFLTPYPHKFYDFFPRFLFLIPINAATS